MKQKISRLLLNAKTELLVMVVLFLSAQKAHHVAGTAVGVFLIFAYWWAAHTLVKRNNTLVKESMRIIDELKDRQAYMNSRIYALLAHGRMYDAFEICRRCTPQHVQFNGLAWYRTVYKEEAKYQAGPIVFISKEE